MNELQSIAVMIFEFCLENKVCTETQWIRREQNAKADCLSRIVDPDDWKLNSRYFYMISLKWGPFDVDKMADNRNTQLNRFNSKFWCPNSEAVDCFTQDWSMTNNWICPPPYLVLSVLRYMGLCSAYGTTVLPEWNSANC